MDLAHGAQATRGGGGRGAGAGGSAGVSERPPITPAAVVGPATARWTRSRRTILRPIPLMRTSSSTVRNGRFLRYATISAALAGPTPGSRPSTSTGAVLRFTTPSTALPAHAG